MLKRTLLSFSVICTALVLLTTIAISLDRSNEKIITSKELKQILAPINCKLNLIPYNEIDGQYRRPTDNSINAFLSSLNNAPFPVTVRWSKGQDIDAGCGQLATISYNNL